MFKDIEKAIGKTAKVATRGVFAVATLGGSEIYRDDDKKKSKKGKENGKT